MYKVDDLLEPALELAKILQTEDGSGVIDKKVKSDISSFGTAIQQCGLLPAVAMYSNSSTDSGKRGVKMLNIIYALLGNKIENANIETDQSFLKMLVDEKDTTCLNILRQETMNACIALKLAVRTFKLEEVNDAKP